MASLAGLIAGYNPTGFATANQQGEANLANTRASLPAIQAQTAREQQLAKQTELENQLKVQQIRDQQIQRQMVIDGGDFLTDPTKYYNEATRRGMTLGNATAGANQVFTLQQNALKLAPDRRAAEEALHQGIKGSVEGYLNNQTPENYAALHAKVSQLEPELLKSMPAPAAGVAPSQQDLAYAIGHIGMVGDLLSRAKETQAIATSKAEAAAKIAEAAKTEQATGEAAAQMAREQTAREQPENPAAQAAALTAQQRTEAEVKKAELERQTRMLEETVAQHKAENSLRGRQIDIEQAKNQREQAIYDQTYGSGANEALVGVEPKLRVPATKAAQDAANEYNKAVAASQDIASLISEARAGNKAAYANMPVEGVLQITTSRGTTRVNRQELEAYAGAGSAFDRLAGKIGKWTTGASIPKDVLNDLEAMHGEFAKNAAANYDRKLQSVNQNYHSNFKAVPGASGAKTIRARDPQGKLHEAPAGTPLPAGWKLEGQ